MGPVDKCGSVAVAADNIHSAVGGPKTHYPFSWTWSVLEDVQGLIRGRQHGSKNKSKHTKWPT